MQFIELQLSDDSGKRDLSRDEVGNHESDFRHSNFEILDNPVKILNKILDMYLESRESPG